MNLKYKWTYKKQIEKNDNDKAEDIDDNKYNNEIKIINEK